jgi:nucleoside-diphosphate-sugar epimerase
MTTTVKPTVLILGARGRLGAALVHAFDSSNWQVVSQVRRRLAADRQETLEADASNAAVVIRELEKLKLSRLDVVINACNPLYTQWEKLALPLNEAAIKIASKTNATLMFPGNVYNYGADMPAQLHSDTMQLAQTRKGRIRIEMESQLERVSHDGVQCIVVRAGDYFGCSPGTWFDLTIAKNLQRGKIVTPGSPDIPRAWAYVPDLAATFVNVATARAQLGVFERIHFPGHTLTLAQVIGEIESQTARQYSIGRLPWPVIRALSFAVPMWREIAELSYLWERPHELCVAPEHRTLIAKQTPLRDALQHAVNLIHPNLLSTTRVAA